MEIFSKFGYVKIICTFLLCLIMFLIGTTAVRISNSGAIEKALMEYDKQAKDKENLRRGINPKINSLLDRALVNTKADRIFIFEYHNGTQSLVGVPFIYAEMTYERYKDGVIPTLDEFSKLNTSRYPIFNYVNKYGKWEGTIQDLEKFDPRLAKRFDIEGINYIYIRNLLDKNMGNTIIAFDSCTYLESSYVQYYQEQLNYKISNLFKL